MHITLLSLFGLFMSMLYQYWQTPRNFSSSLLITGVTVNLSRIHMGVDGVMIVRVTPGVRLGMCMHGYSEVTVDLHVRG